MSRLTPITPNSSDNIGQLLGRSVWTSSGRARSDDPCRWTAWKAWCWGTGYGTFTNHAFGGSAYFFSISLSVGGITIPFHSQVSANRIGSFLLPLRFSLDRSVFSCSGAFPSPFTPSFNWMLFRQENLFLFDGVERSTLLLRSCQVIGSFFQ